MKHQAHGFTIVELLIVIVVIASLARKIEVDAVDRGSYIPGGSAAGDSTTFPGVTFSPAKNSYHTGASNLIYCTGTNASGGPEFVIEARSKSEQSFRYVSGSGLQPKSGGVSIAATCAGLSSTSHSYGFYGSSSVWWSWTN